jgi:hypothetical protein
MKKLLDTRGYRGDLGIRVGPGIFRVRDQPIDRPPLDLVRRPRPLIFAISSRAVLSPDKTRFRPRLGPVIVGDQIGEGTASETAVGQLPLSGPGDGAGASLLACSTHLSGILPGSGYWNATQAIVTA